MIGVYGGTFDPIHYGHLRPALEILEAFALSHIRFIPCGQPPHRDPPHASAAQRLAMVQRGIAGVAGFVCDEREVRRPGPSYMIDTLRSLRQELPGEDLCLLLGMDAFAGLPGWHDWRGILQLCKVLVMQRPQFEAAQAICNTELKHYVADNAVTQPQAFVESGPGRLMFYGVTQLNISSTQIRETIRQRRSARFLLPEQVIELIERDSIYH